ncbi:histidinol dehydrogenase [Amphiplicatus metriothermophilus]|uniref:Histidinol dehydrogenase n=1 Tax=Amphiplicatus metriothermophilus TaxID=1519374 RepID=A0A239PSU5_9PROT|nr:histidinol dehydrogenase [Amphiplicatus metriothermophilus]MBB5519280.1 histidinol dehydrogenase [Amphiplicatus metriothermophilus]SNT73349.1 histidinol dehydrogenase [Amphiplicatus metriothermophilus]
MVRRLSTADDGFEATFAALVEAPRAAAENIAAAVSEIVAAVRTGGMTALVDYTKRFDRFDLTAENICVGEEEIAQAESRCDSETLAALDFAAARIRAYHEKQKPEGLRYTDEAGVTLGWRWTPVDAAGLYAPGGRAAYPSSVLMNAIPAKVAGVGRLCLCVPAPDGSMNPLVLAAARRAGVDEIYRIGGAQAIAAMAWGAGPIGPVDVIVGPGNAYVAEAKRQVFGRVGIDSIAGPSEILVVADGANVPDWIAADLLSQSEHDPSSQSILMTDDAGFADQVAAAVEVQLAASPRREIAAAAWRDNGAIILVRSFDEAPALVDRLAPEHLELAVADPEALLEKIRHAGAIFLGRHAPEAVGDYVAGPDHVLPTARAARYASGLSVLDFMKRSSIIGCDPEGLAAIGPAAARLADAEGLPSHAQSIRLRLK